MPTCVERLRKSAYVPSWRLLRLDINRSAATLRCSGAMARLGFFPSRNGCNGQSACSQSRTSDFELPADQAAPLDCFQRCAAVVMEFSHRDAVLERIHLVVTSFHQHGWSWLAAEAIFPQWAGERWAVSHFKGGALLHHKQYLRTVLRGRCGASSSAFAAGFPRRTPCLLDIRRPPHFGPQCALLSRRRSQKGVLRH